MSTKVAINGFGRIGRQALKAMLENHKNIEVVGINDLVDTESNAHLFKYDSNYGRFDGTVETDGNDLVINGKHIRITAERDPANLPVEGVLNWSPGWLPSLYQGTGVRAREPRILNLEPPAHLRGKPQENYLDFLGTLNRDHVEKLPGELDLEARIASFELAARMQTAAADVMDISSESEATKKLYGLDVEETKEFGTRCLIARRLIERGVRFVQVFTKNQYWDHHGNIKNSLPAACKKVDRPIAALVKALAENADKEKEELKDALKKSAMKAEKLSELDLELGGHRPEHRRAPRGVQGRRLGEQGRLGCLAGGR